MLRSCGVIVVTWGALGALGGRSWRTWCSKMPRDGNKKPRGSPKIRIGGVKGGTEGAPRGDEGRQGFGSAAWGQQTGDIGGSSWRVLGEDSARPDHAKAWGGRYIKMPSAHATDLFFVGCVCNS